MPRGNDSAAAVADLISKGGVTTNAEKLIDAVRDARSPELEAASMKTLDAEATAELDISKAKVPRGHTVLSGAVRGGKTIYVVEDANGRAYKLLEGDKVDEEQHPSKATDPGAADPGDLTVPELRDLADSLGVSHNPSDKKADLVEKIQEARAAQG